MNEHSKQVQVKISCRDLNKECDFFHELGFQLLHIFPADNPRYFILIGYGMMLRIEKGLPVNDLTLILPSEQAKSTVYSPSGVTIQFQQEASPEIKLPNEIEIFINPYDVDTSWVTGRAGMLYRDLIPSRLKGAMIASNIKIPEAGPVPDHVHFHSIQFQLIFCVKGWVKVVYEDQGEPFVLTAGDCVTQPPGIRHQVLEASEGMEVLEIGLPAEHMTSLDHQLTLPTGKHLPDRNYSIPGVEPQKFHHYQQKNAQWIQWQQGALKKSRTRVSECSGGLAAVNVLKADQGYNNEINLQHHDCLRFYYVINGQVTISQTGQQPIDLKSRGCFVLPANEQLVLNNFAADFQCVEFILNSK